MSDLNPIRPEETLGLSNSSALLLSIPSSTAGPIRRRRFNAAKIHPTRIKKVMQSDEEIGRMVASVPVAIGRAMEHFAEKFLQAAAQQTQLRNSRTLAPAHMKLAMMANRHFHFLADIFKEVGVPGHTEIEYDPSLAREQMLILEAALSTASTGPSNASLASSPCTPVSPVVMSGPSSHDIPTSSNGANFSMAIPPSVPYNMPCSPLLPNITVPGKEKPICLQQLELMGYGDMTASSYLTSASSTLDTRKAVNGKKTDTIIDGEKPKRGRPRKMRRSEKCLDEELCSEVTNRIEKEDQDRALMPPPALPLGRARPVA